MADNKPLLPLSRGWTNEHPTLLSFPLTFHEHFVGNEKNWLAFVLQREETAKGDDSGSFVLSNEVKNENA